ncbi:MAG: type II toxin-antitoxin system MqsA family antitoxin [Chloroflexi bacterium]|nr:MAG: type II toxin-antitoxin system MqsA family antitoxin [Chloroflexota bacterium]
MICLICRQSEVVDSRTSMSFQRGEIHLVINNVPARACQSCGEAYVEEEVAARLLHIANEMSRAGMSTGASEYPRPQE